MFFENISWETKNLFVDLKISKCVSFVLLSLDMKNRELRSFRHETTFNITDLKIF